MPSKPMSTSLGLLRHLQADVMLGDTPPYKFLRKTLDDINYRGYKPSKYFELMQERIGTIGAVQLQHNVHELNAGEYQIDVGMSFERVMDAINTCNVDITALKGHVISRLDRIKSMREPFRVYWSLGAMEIIQDTPLAKLSATDLKALASLEFTLTIEEADGDMSSLLEAIDLTLDNLKAARRLAEAKYDLAKDQVNNVMAGMDFSSRGTSYSEPTTHASREAMLARQFGDRVITRSPAPKANVHEHDPEEDAFIPTLAKPSKKVDVKREPVLKELPEDDDDIPPPIDYSNMVWENPPEAEAVIEAARITPSTKPKVEAAPKVVEPTKTAPTKVEPTKGKTPKAKVEPAKTEAVKPKPQVMETLPPYRKGDPFTLLYPVDINAPGVVTAKNYPPPRRNRSKVTLTAQLDPTENGDYLYMGETSPLVPLTVKCKVDTLDTTVNPAESTENIESPESVEVGLYTESEPELYTEPYSEQEPKPELDPEPEFDPESEPEPSIEPEPIPEPEIYTEPYIEQEPKPALDLDDDPLEDLPPSVKLKLLNSRKPVIPEPEPEQDENEGDEDPFEAPSQPPAKPVAPTVSAVHGGPVIQGNLGKLFALRLTPVTPKPVTPAPGVTRSPAFPLPTLNAKKPSNS